MAEIELKKKCYKCFGDGVWVVHAPEHAELPCPVCDGSGRIHYCFAEIPQLDTIMSEQESQRTDLTNALSAIWEKVKNL